MLTYEQFERYLTEIKRCDERAEQIYEVLGKCEAFDECCSVDISLDLLSLLMDDIYQWISYWFFDMDYGTKWDANTVTNSNGKPIVCTTMRQLYDFLMQDAGARKLYSAIPTTDSR